MAPTTSDEDWDWEFSPRAEKQFAQVDSDSQQRIIDSARGKPDPETVQQFNTNVLG